MALKEKSHRVTPRRAWAVVAAAVLAAAAAGAEQSPYGDTVLFFSSEDAVEKSATETWRAAAGATSVEITNRDGDVAVTVGGDRVVVKATKRVAAAPDDAVAALAAVRVVHAQAGGKVTVGVKYPRVYIGPGVEVALEVTVPADVPVVATTDFGDVTVTGVATASASARQGDVTVVDAATRADVETYGGAVVVKNAAAVTARNSAGPVSIWGPSRNVMATSSSGDVTLDTGGGAPASVYLATSSGNILVSLALPAKGGYVSLESSSGNVAATVTGELGDCTVDLSTSSGKLKLPIYGEIKGEKFYRQAPAADATYVRAASSSGNVTVTYGGAAAEKE